MLHCLVAYVIQLRHFLLWFIDFLFSLWEVWGIKNNNFLIIIFVIFGILYFDQKEICLIVQEYCFKEESLIYFWFLFCVDFIFESMSDFIFIFINFFHYPQLGFIIWQIKLHSKIFFNNGLVKEIEQVSSVLLISRYNMNIWWAREPEHWWNRNKMKKYATWRDLILLCQHCLF